MTVTCILLGCSIGVVLGAYLTDRYNLMASFSNSLLGQHRHAQEITDASKNKANAGGLLLLPIFALFHLHVARVFEKLEICFYCGCMNFTRCFWSTLVLCDADMVDLTHKPDRADFSPLLGDDEMGTLSHHECLAVGRDDVGKGHDNNSSAHSGAMSTMVTAMTTSGTTSTVSTTSDDSIKSSQLLQEASNGDEDKNSHIRHDTAAQSNVLTAGTVHTATHGSNSNASLDIEQPHYNQTRTQLDNRVPYLAPAASHHSRDTQVTELPSMAYAHYSRVFGDRDVLEQRSLYSSREGAVNEPVLPLQTGHRQDSMWFAVRYIDAQEKEEIVSLMRDFKETLQCSSL